ncbi:MmoB/DmpM family protein [Rhodococcus sp. NPDC057014]|uniref:MmoB/DmpM family protein n=1 Tax=unclassified Rhodococcus (in: high G+C Gram-positive bacteria) TaxID=192944 RepID=UPI003628D86D
MKNPVGPVLRMGEEVDQIIAAIEDDNPDTDIEIIDRGSYVRIQGEERVVLTEASLQAYLGSDYRIRSLENLMSSFSGRAITASDSITWLSSGARKDAAPVTEGADR